MTSQEEVCEGARRICALVSSGEPFFIGRNGTVELQALYFWVVQRRCERHGAVLPPYPKQLKETLERNAGIFPVTDTSIDAWCSAYAEAIGTMDGTAAGWYRPLAQVESAILDTYATLAPFRCPLRSLEPYYVEPDLQWTRHLGAQKVCVVTSFADTVGKQLVRGLDQVWPKGLISSETTWIPIQTGYAPKTAQGRAGWPAGVSTWQDAITHIMERIEFYKPKTVVIGCGGLGMVLGGVARRAGYSVIVLGGATQLLFGVKGRRWETHDVISKFWNSAWVWPAAEEKPGGAAAIEGGCYWG